uniref:Uncharacterized protein MANES_01G071500 n=1 Tax=Rhizophora mucronata TaxID=61149 RepID=A0A2P2JFC8_RHIMU
MHFPSALKERLIDLASSSVCPSLPDLSMRSEPARSTTTSLPLRTNGGFKPFIVWELLPFSLERAVSLPLPDLFTCTIKIA